MPPSTTSPPPYKITHLPPPGPAVLSIRPEYRPSSPTTPHHPPTASPSSTVPQTFHDALSIRDAVFTGEQHCPLDEDIDADDAVSAHWVLYARRDESSSSESAPMVPAATIRLVPARAPHDDSLEGHAGGGGVEGPDYERCELWDGKEPYAMIGRLATMKEFRGRGYGGLLVGEALRWAGGHGGDLLGAGGEWKGLLLAHAQAYVQGWYAGLGWRIDEGMGRWDECGIQHVGMWRRVEVQDREGLEGKGA